MSAVVRVDGARVYVGAASALLSDAVRRAKDGLPEPHAAALTRGAGRAAPEVWAHLLGGDAALQAALEGADPTSGAAGRAVIEAIRRAAEPDQPLEVLAAAVRAAAEAAAGTVTGRRRGARLAGDVAVEVRSEPLPYAVRHRRAELAAPADLKGRKRTAWIAARAAEQGAEQVVARLSGGPFGRSLQVALVGASRLEWAAAVWALAAAPLERSPDPFARSAGGAGGEDSPVVVMRNGAPIAFGRLTRDEIADALDAEDAPVVAAEEVDTFIAEETRERDDGQRLPDEQRYLEEIAGDDLVDLPPDLEALARSLARVLLEGKPHAPALRAVRAVVADDFRTTRLRLTDRDRRIFWARALAHHARAEQEAAQDRVDAAAIEIFLTTPPPAYAVLAAPGGVISDPWLRLVAWRAAAAEVDAFRARLARPAGQRRSDELRAALGPEPDLRPLRVAAAEARDAAAGVRTLGVRCEGDAISAARAAQGDLGPGECAVAVREVASTIGAGSVWWVVRGTLPALLAAGLDRLELRGGVPFGLWEPPLGDAAEVLEAAVRAACDAWRRGGCDGEPPPLEDAVRAALAPRES